MSTAIEDHVLVGIHVHNRMEQAVDVQRLLTEYGANIKTRLGLHETQAAQAGNGLIIVETGGDRARVDELIDKLSAIDGVEADKMVFAH
jgi:metal-responsive CopG/Arc/MetJ family transcriptional regulator